MRKLASGGENSTTGAAAGNEDENSQQCLDLQVKIREVATGAILSHAEMPPIADLDAWLDSHPE